MLSAGGVYVEVEGRHFGLEVRVRVKRFVAADAADEVLHEVDSDPLLLPVFRARVWALRHGYGWPPRRA